ncbi:hypothetical protein B0H19DRAFT_536084 [Mycena capillaripes]|nr:hypothetical protein B0H19DRAFT_536084 [Mycena capillaripes]
MPTRAMDSSTEAAASKLWAVYVSEAEKYDKSLIESWKSDMEGMLIFAGLFSASLTAFIIESYKTLIPDSGNSTVQLLAQISQQLSAAANGSHFQIPEPTLFTPPTSSLVCNALWFISLGLSLTCALIATLLEQWARDFLHRVDMRSAPVIRARIFSYLYYGLKRFGMHAVVDIIPLLLHASLFLFFAGLVAFLLPINFRIAAMAATILGAVVVIYVVLTLLPLLYLDCPYRTPLSAACWRISRLGISVWRRFQSAGDNGLNTANLLPSETIIKAMSTQATTQSPTRSDRDYQALVWTVKSLSDDEELEPFVEALPDVLWGPFPTTHGYGDHIQRLIRQPDLQFQSRIEGFFDSCGNGLLSPEVSKRRRITFYKALWAITSAQHPAESPDYAEALDFTQLISRMECYSWQSGEILHHHASSLALVRWSTFCSVQSRLDAIGNYLAQCNVDVQRGLAVDLSSVITYMETLLRFRVPMSDWSRLDEFNPPGNSASEIIPRLLRAISEFNLKTPYRILFEYIQDSSILGSEPYRWHATRNVICLGAAPFSAFHDMLAHALTAVVAHRGSEKHAAKRKDWNDTCVQELCSFWRPNEPVSIPYGILDYLANNNSAEALQALLAQTSIGFDLLFCFPITLSHGPSARPFPRLPAPDPSVVVNAALWRLASLMPDTLSPARAELILEALQMVTNSWPVVFSSIAMIKSIFLGSLLDYHPPSSRSRVPPLRHPLFPTKTAIHTPSVFLDVDVVEEPDTYDPFTQLLRNRIVEAKISHIPDFLDGFRSDFTPYKATETLRRICGDVPIPEAEIHATYQARFANGIHHLVQTLDRDNSSCAELLDAIFDSKIFEVYFDAGRKRHSSGFPSDRHPWLQDFPARSRLRDTLREYFPTKPTSSEMPPRIRAIFEGLQYLHDSS